MAEPTMRDVLDQLATMQATVQRQGAELARYRQRTQRGRTARRALPLLLAGLLVALLPLALLAANPTFSDLNDAAEVHRPNIQAIGNAGITTGFADPNNPNARLYNPKGLVTRGEMATFLARTAGLGGNAPVVNAATAQQLGGQPASAYQLAGQPIANATNAQNAANSTAVGSYPLNGLLQTYYRVGTNVQYQPGVLSSLSITNPTAAPQLWELRGRFDLGVYSSSGGETLPPATITADIRRQEDHAVYWRVAGYWRGGYTDPETVAFNGMIEVAPGTHVVELYVASPVGAPIGKPFLLAQVHPGAVTQAQP